MRLFPRFSEQLRASAPLRALIVPQISGMDAVAVNRTSSANALRALGPSTLVGIPGEAAVGMRIIGQLVRRLPSYTVELGSDSAANASAVREVIADAV